MKNFTPETKYIDTAKYPPPMGSKHSTHSEIASRIAAATRSNDDAVAVPGLEESGVETAGNDNLPPSEWSPKSVPSVNLDCEAIIPLPNSAATLWPIVGHDPRYTTLRAILDAAFAHAATGKGKERHARDLPFDEQPMLETTRLVGPGFPLGQAIKKAGEAAGMIERGQMDMAEAECLGAINYLAGAVAWMRERKVAA